MRKEDKMYQDAYGDIPNTQLDRIAYILGKKADNEIFNKSIAACARKVNRIKKRSIEFTMIKLKVNKTP